MGKFFLNVRQHNGIDQNSWFGALNSMLHMLKNVFPRHVEGEESLFTISSHTESEYAFELNEESKSNLCDRSPKLFRLRWKWDSKAIENNLDGHSGENWNVVRVACEFLCTFFPQDLVLVVEGEFSGYDDGKTMMVFDGSSRKCKIFPRAFWPRCEDTEQLSIKQAKTLKPSFSQAADRDEFEEEIAQMLHSITKKPIQSSTRTLSVRKHVGRSKFREDSAAQSNDTKAEMQEREAIARHNAEELIREEEEAKKQKYTRTMKAKSPNIAKKSEKDKKRSKEESSSRRLDSDGISIDAEGPRERSSTSAAKLRMARTLAAAAHAASAETDSEKEAQDHTVTDWLGLDALAAAWGDSDSDAQGGEWESARDRRRTGETGAAAGAGVGRAAAVRRFLETWKTAPCGDPTPHDWRLCGQHHAALGGQDARRDPFREQYLPSDARSKAEEVYHPINFRTRLCGRAGGACPFREPCVCAFAHSTADLREMPEADYVALFGPAQGPERPPAMLGDFLHPLAVAPHHVVPPPPPLGWCGGAMSRAAALAPATLFLPLTGFQSHLVANSGKLWKRVEDMAGLYMCRIELHQPARGGGTGVLVSGERAEAEMVVDNVRAVMDRPPEDLVSFDSESHSTRVIALVAETLRAHGEAAFGLGPRDGVSVEADVAAGRIAVRALRSPARPGLGREVLGQIRFWLRQQGLDRFVECAACCDSINLDQGVGCPGGHVFCSRDDGGDETCMAALIRSQLAAIRAQGGALVCPVCRAAFSDKEVAAGVSGESWAAVQRAVLEAQVERRYAELQSEFDQRLQQKVRELVERFDRGDVSELVSQQGAVGAAEARNSVLNLACPYTGCRTVYAEFDGCMALQCASCQQHFCGFCHKAASTSRGCHDHVRECDMNLTGNGSYYASAEVIREAQRRYRVKRLKQFLRSGSYKKDVQNSIVFHLSTDLKELGIDPAALFDVGNLQGEGEAGDVL